MMRRQITLLMAVLFAVAALATAQVPGQTAVRAGADTFSAQVAAALSAPTGGVATLTLDADYTADAAISVPVGTQLVIDGAGHTLTLGAGTNFVLQDGITLKNLKIDATALTEPLIAMGDTTGTGKHNKVLFAGVDGYSNINQNAWILENPVTVENCMVRELATPFYDANKYAWALDELNIRKSIIQMNNDAKSFINMDGADCAIVKVMNITENTIYNLKDNASKFFIKGSNASNTQPKKIYGTTAAGAYVWTISNNTMVKTFSKKDFANSTPSINTVTMAVKGNVFLDVYRLQKLFGNCVKDYERNIIWANEITLDGTDKGTYCTEADPGFKAPTTALDLTAENGGLDLTVGASTRAAKFQAGDPRWMVAFVADVDKTALENEISLAKLLLGSVSESEAGSPAEAFAAAIAAAEDVNAHAEFQYEVVAATSALNAAEKTYARALLTAEIALATERLGTNPVDADPGKALYEAIARASEVNNDETSSVAALAAATAMLKAANALIVVPEDVKVTIASGDISAALDEALAKVKVVKDIRINLTNGGEYTISKSIVVPNSLYIVTGDIMAWEQQNATIDASGLEGPMITTPAEAPGEWVKGQILVDDVTVKGLKKALFASAAKNYFYEQFSIWGCVVEQAADATTLDFTKGSVAKDLMISSSTFYAPTATTKSFYSSQSGQKATEYNEGIQQRFAIFGSTMYNLAPSKNFFSHRQSNQKWLVYSVQSNIFVNCGKSGQVIKGINGGQQGTNPTWIVANNIFNFDGEDTSAKEETGDADEPVKGSAAGVMTFNSVETPDFGGVFTLAEGAAKPSAIGDVYHWTVTYNETATGIEAVKTAEGADLENAVIYNLNGQRIDKAQAKSGVFIVNGKKVILK